MAVTERAAKISAATATMLVYRGWMLWVRGSGLDRGVEAWTAPERAAEKGARRDGVATNRGTGSGEGGA